MGFWCGLLKNMKETINEYDRKKKHFTTNLWNKFSGKDKFEEADHLYNEISKKYKLEKDKFESEVEGYTSEIEAHVDRINQSKVKIKTILFSQMAKKLEQIKDIKISDDFSVEAYIAEVLSFDSVREKKQLFKIDFNKHKVKTSVQAIATLGFFTRGKAKETLHTVKEEADKVSHEITKMKAALVKLRIIEESLANVEYYFTSLIELYEVFLVRLDSSINYLYVKCMTFAHKLVHNGMSVKRLSKMQLEEVNAIITISKILKTMTDAQILSIEDDQEMAIYGKEMEQHYRVVTNLYQAV